MRTRFEIFEDESPVFAISHPYYRLFRRLLAVHQIGNNYYECAATVDNRQALRDAGICWSAATIQNGQYENGYKLAFVL